jgi:sugar lactone lactonase YvrE
MLCVKPAGLAVGDGQIWIADIGRGSLLEWSAQTNALRGARLNPPPAGPVGATTLPDGNLLVLDGGAGRGVVYSADGRLIRALTLREGRKFRPVDAAVVRDEVWFSNAAEHCIEIFSLTGGNHLRTVGKRGDGRGEFGFPLGIAWDGSENVYVADMLNARVQVFRPDGQFSRQLGGPGTRVGAFGRPKDVALGPDGTVFVVDAASQQVHAFDSAGSPLLAFGSPSDGRTGLWLPNSIAVSREPVPAAMTADRAADYYLLVTEQMFDAGVRVFAWHSAQGRTISTPAATAHAPKKAINPHWSAAGCRMCHGDASPPGRISAGEVNNLCLSCHDGVRAVADPHPIAVPAQSAEVRVPAGWPVHDGRIGCLTCHDIQQHCRSGAARPAVNPALVRAYDASQPLQFCANCHDPGSIQRLNPHERTDAAGCGLCHVNAEGMRRDGRRTGAASLNDPTPRACLRCHTEHWDYAPGGHLSKRLKESHVARLQSRVKDGYLESAPGMTLGIPLFSESISCYTCHNPHGDGIFPRGTELDRRASTPRDRSIHLRADQRELCTWCHTPS